MFLDKWTEVTYLTVMKNFYFFKPNLREENPMLFWIANIPCSDSLSPRLWKLIWNVIVKPSNSCFWLFMNSLRLKFSFLGYDSLLKERDLPSHPCYSRRIISLIGLSAEESQIAAVWHSPPSSMTSPKCCSFLGNLVTCVVSEGMIVLMKERPPLRVPSAKRTVGEAVTLSIYASWLTTIL